MNSELLQALREVRAGFVVGTGAVEDHIGVARQQVAALFQLRRADANCAWQHARIGQVVQRMPQVHDERLLALAGLGHLHHAHQFRPGDARVAQVLEEGALVPDAFEDPRNQRHCEQEHAEPRKEMEERGRPLCEIAEEAAAEDVHGGPDERPRHVVREETCVAHAGLARDGRGDGRQSRHKLREQERGRAVPAEVALRLAYAGACLKRQAADQPYDASAIALAGHVPERIRGGARHQDRQHGRHGMDAVRRRQCARGDQQRHGRDGHAKLFHQHPEEENAVGIMHEKVECDGHGESTCCSR